MTTNLAERIKAEMGDNPRWHPSDEGGEVAVVVVEHEGTLPCGCASWRENEPHPGFPLREHYGPATVGPEQFTVIVSRDGRATHFACGENVASVSL